MPAVGSRKESDSSSELSVEIPESRALYKPAGCRFVTHRGRSRAARPHSWVSRAVLQIENNSEHFMNSPQFNALAESRIHEKEKSTCRLERQLCYL